MKNAWSLIRPPSSASTAQINLSSSIRLAVLFASLALAACIEPGEQVVDVEWVPEIANPSYPMGEGPVVLVDAAHGNYHTIDGSFESMVIAMCGRRTGSVQGRPPVAHGRPASPGDGTGLLAAPETNVTKNHGGPGAH